MEPGRSKASMAAIFMLVLLLAPVVVVLATPPDASAGAPRPPGAGPDDEFVHVVGVFPIPAAYQPRASADADERRIFDAAESHSFMAAHESHSDPLRAARPQECRQGNHVHGYDSLCSAHTNRRNPPPAGGALCARRAAVPAPALGRRECSQGPWQGRGPHGVPHGVPRHGPPHHDEDKRAPPLWKIELTWPAPGSR
ncbi:MAG: hypothetical protein J3K34DRAFT_439231 [Monoraphidium minutum]|nr:MAG: hypothetical protein J3K34DRAFT_439231 [Monoraphidium minutum]